ncbi:MULTISPECIES: TrbC/VirB2 family protein [unclassified Neorhizobium]|uniref:TrbC/VirB2 family protein n=1 Tax=unclassified Neorhizobium TaxID=2629175 RepID=UPI001FF2BB35|nr:MULTISPECIES: TrbC/VirB2 family protein [unclassified Neorhizobium]MCJ9670392.1 TrbC/VirB2 family protein [Neorhizobium sp. SHOUNA12B]MCJ9746295.1 TrbC/VirB2 family protein [Neorhizobium sp. SHOUNA12A]
MPDNAGWLLREYLKLSTLSNYDGVKMNFFRDYFRDIDLPKLLFAVAIFIFMWAEPSLAQNFEGVNTFMNKLVGAITGPIGASVSAIAVIAIGFSFMTGRMDWTFAVSVVLGIAIVFGGAAFLNGIGVAGNPEIGGGG